VNVDEIVEFVTTCPSLL